MSIIRLDGQKGIHPVRQGNNQCFSFYWFEKHCPTLVRANG